MKLAALVTTTLMLTARGSGAFEIEVSRSQVHIPAGTRIVLEAPANINVDEFRLDGELTTGGYLLKVVADSISIGSAGLLGAYPTGDTPAKPPKKASFSTAAATGAILPAQLSGAWYLGGTANGGANGADGETGDKGVAGTSNPGPVLFSARDLVIDGRIELRGQQGSSGGDGQDGQDGGAGARGRDAACGKGNTSYYCYAGSTKSGPGGLGGMGGAGGVGGTGGTAVPLLLFALERQVFSIAPRSDPGSGGIGGDPGNVGLIGPVGGEGSSCSATPNWGRAFGSCSAGGGARTSEQRVDTRLEKNFGKGPNGKDGDHVRWETVGTLLNLKHRLPLLSKNVASVSIASEGIAGEIVFGAISIELTARLAITIREVMGRHDAAEDVETKRKIVEDVGPKLLAVSKKLEALTPSAQGLTELLRLSQKSDYATRLSLTLPILRDSFASQRSRLLARCSSLEAAASTYFAENAPAYFPREFGLCVPGNYSWVPFVLDRQSVTVGTRLAEVPNVLRPFFSVEPAPIPTDSGSITNDGLIIQEVGRQASEQMSANREFLSGLLAGKLAPAVLKLGGVGGTVSEKLSRLNNDLAILGGLDRESHTRAE